MYLEEQETYNDFSFTCKLNNNFFILTIQKKYNIIGYIYIY